MKRLLVSLVLFVFASSVGAAELGKRGKKEYMGACSRQNPAELYSITNGSNAESCSDEQTVGSVTILCQCLSDDGVTFVWTKVGGSAASDLSGYALLAGDADGQTIQGRTGANKARVDIGEAVDTIAQLRGAGATPGYVQANESGAYLSSADEGTYLDLYDGVIEFSTDGVFSASANFVRIISLQTPPTNANDACTAGDTIDTATFHYYCAATDTWVRVAMATWP